MPVDASEPFLLPPAPAALVSPEPPVLRGESNHRIELEEIDGVWQVRFTSGPKGAINPIDVTRALKALDRAWGIEKRTLNLRRLEELDRRQQALRAPALEEPSHAG